MLAGAKECRGVLQDCSTLLDAVKRENPEFENLIGLLLVWLGSGVWCYVSPISEHGTRCAAPAGGPATTLAPALGSAPRSSQAALEDPGFLTALGLRGSPWPPPLAVAAAMSLQPAC